MKTNNKSAWAIIITACLFFENKLSAQHYQEDINAWYQTRTESLTAENGWLNLAGLYWLEPGINSFGSGDKVKIKFPTGTINAEAGYLEWNGDSVIQHTTNGTSILVNGVSTQKAVVYNKSTAPVSAAGNLRWTIIKRGDKIGLRLRDIKSEAVTGFKGIDHFKADTNFIVKAVLNTKPIPAYISITNVLGQVSQEKSPGTLHFKLNNKEYTLDALEENNELFIIFGDATSGKTTYSSGRFLTAQKADADGNTVLDFNKAYNPPCAFTKYATCPLPPKQNVLPVAITAGEKNY